MLHAVDRRSDFGLKRSGRSVARAAALAAWGTVSLLSGLLTLVRAPSMLFLKLKVGATEYGYLLSVVHAAFYVFSAPLVRRESFSGPARVTWTACVVAAAALTAVPAFRAAVFAKGVPRRLAEAFGEPASRPRPGAKPFRFRRLARFLSGSLSEAERVVFAKTPEYSLEFDLYRPRRQRPGGAPCVVVVHGGKWTEGHSREFASLNPYLARRGYAVVGVNYRKADRYPFPAARDDLNAALGYVKRNAKRLGVDPERIALLGRSAGGQLALLVAYQSEDDAVKGVVSLYGPTDMRYGYQDPTNPWVIDHEAALELYLSGDPESAAETYDSSSPVNFAAADSPATLLVHGAHDELVHVAQSDLLAEKLRKVGARHLYLRLPWATHGFDRNLNGPSGQISTYAVEGFLRGVLGE